MLGSRKGVRFAVSLRCELAGGRFGGLCKLHNKGVETMEHGKQERFDAGRAGSQASAVAVKVLLVVYVVVLVWIILFKMQVSFDVFDSTLRSVNLVPLAGALVVNGAVNYGEVVLNMLVFVPFGLYVGALAPGRSFWRKLVPIVLTSLALETLQFVFAAGATDVTDVLANALGGALGLGACALARRVLRSDARVVRVCAVGGTCCTVLFLAFVGVVLLANA